MNLFQKPIPVLMYHRIAPPDSASSLIVSPKSFARQIEWLEKKGFRFLSLEEVVDRQGKITIGDRAVALTFDDGFRDNWEALSLISKKGKPASLFIVVNWVEQNGFLNWKEIRELSDAGVSIGSHSLTHRWLPSISDSSELEREISDSKKRIEDEIGKKVHWFSYPVGGVDQRVADCVEKAGYRAAWVAAARPSNSVTSPFWCLRRVKVGSNDSSLFRFSVKAYGMKGYFSGFGGDKKLFMQF